MDTLALTVVGAYGSAAHESSTAFSNDDICNALATGIALSNGYFVTSGRYPVILREAYILLLLSHTWHMLVCWTAWKKWMQVRDSQPIEAVLSHILG